MLERFDCPESEPPRHAQALDESEDYHLLLIVGQLWNSLLQSFLVSLVLADSIANIAIDISVAELAKTG